MLISLGHNSEYRDPYRYSIKKLFRLSAIHKERLRGLMLTDIIADHQSRIACASGDASGFSELIEQLTKEE